MVDLGHLDKALFLQAEKALERAHHEGGAAHLYTGNLASEALLFRKAGIDFGDGNAENAVVRGAPYRSFSVIGQFGDTVGAQAVVHVDAPDFLALCVHRNDTVRSRGQQGAVFVQFETLIHLDVLPAVHYGFFLALPARHGGVGHLDGIAFEGFDPSREVDAVEEDGAVHILAQTHHAGDVRCVHDFPVHVVVDQQTFKVGEEGVAVFVAQDVDVTVVGVVLTGGIVPEERDAHIGIGPALRGSRHRAQQHGGHQ